jgi:pyruvate,water dikinase
MGSEQHVVIGLNDVDERQVALVGGKAANLGALSRIDGVAVPPGFCVTTDAFRRTVAQIPGIEDRLDALARLRADDHDAIGARSAELRTALEAAAIPADVEAAIVAATARLGEADAAYAVRSSATAEDTPTASFAGQHDSYLDVAGPAAVLEHVRRTWGSLFTERTVAYRLRHGADHRDVAMAVVVQRMVDARAAGVLFTADPVSGHRRTASIEAVAGLGEALVSGRADPDVFTVRDDAVVARAERHGQAVLTDAQAVALARLGRRIEARLGRPQDIEWCLAGDAFVVVQSRPITTLFPVPAAPDAAPRVYVSVGHGQMMTDAMKPLGRSVFQLTAMPVMHEAGSRLFVEVTDRLASPAAAAGMIAVMGRSDPLVGDALQTVIDRGFVPTVEDGGAPARPVVPPAPAEPDPALVPELVAQAEASLAGLVRAVAPLAGAAVLDLVADDIRELKRVTFDPRSLPLIMAGMEASWWLDDHLETWLGEKHAADTLTLSVSGDVTAEMGLALLDVADAIRPHPEVVAFLKEVEDEDFLEALPALRGGPRAREAIAGFLDRYGMRCVGEIDLTRPRWSERPTTVVPLILGNITNFAPGERARRFERGRQAAAEKEREVLARLRALPDGERKADEAKRMIDRVRAFSGYREYPKYHIISRYFIYKKALLAEARRLVAAGVLREPEDAFFLTFQELREAVRAQAADGELIARRRRRFAADATLSPPRVLTSEGEAIAGSHRRDGLPAGALIGVPVSTGTVEGRARVIVDMADARVQPGDILVTAHTDPSWSPLFVAVAGLVTEVGGRMTHGAVIAREYGLPAVVGLEEATKVIRDGQRIRVHGTDGFVELLS